MGDLDILLEWIKNNKRHLRYTSYHPDDKEIFVVDYDDLLAKIIFLKNNSQAEVTCPNCKERVSPVALGYICPSCYYDKL